MLIMGCNWYVHGCRLKVTDENVICINKIAQENCWKCISLGCAINCEPWHEIWRTQHQSCGETMDTRREIERSQIGELWWLVKEMWVGKKNNNTIYFIFVHVHFTLDMYLNSRNHLRSLVFLYLFESLFELDYSYKPPYAQNIQQISTQIV
jgi:hypothetical protein